MNKRQTHIVFIIVFMALLLAPLFFVDWHGGKMSEQENRMLAGRPPKALMIESPSEFIEQTDDWFSDNVGFREKMILLYKQLDKIEVEGVHSIGYYTYLIGGEGHEFFDDEGVQIAKFQGSPALSDEELSGLVLGLNEIKEYLDEKGIPMIVMFGTDKETVYPEYYPKSIMRGPEPIPLDIVTNYLQENTGVDVFNIKQCLLDQKDNFLLYDKKVHVQGIDVVHYNEIGGFFAYQELMRHINKYLPETTSFTVDDLDISYDENDSPLTSLKQGVAYKFVENNYLGELEEESPDMWRNLEIENENKDLPNILVMGDSNINLKTIRDGKTTLKYMDALPMHFSKTGLIHYDYMDHFKEFVEYYDPDVVVFESAERQLDLFADQISTFRNN